MLDRREFLTRSLKGSTLIALGDSVPGFLASTALAAEKGTSKKDTVLVVVELTGGNDGLNTVIPHGDDLYHKARPTLRYHKNNVIRVDDHIGLNPGLGSLENLLENGQLAIVQGIGYPNPNRSHFESMDVWHTGDPTGKRGDGWLSRALSSIHLRGENPSDSRRHQQAPPGAAGPHERHRLGASESDLRPAPGRSSGSGIRSPLRGRLHAASKPRSAPTPRTPMRSGAPSAAA